MSSQNSRANVLANLFQQGSGAVLVLFVPNILSVQQYSHLTILASLVSLAVLSDLGLNGVYSRKLPGLLARQESETILVWDVTVLLFRVVMAALFGIVAAIFLGRRTGEWGAAVLLPVTLAVASIGAFAISQCVVTGRFGQVKNISLAQSLTRLLCLPGAYLAGVAGWVTGQICVGLALLGFREQRSRLLSLYQSRSLFDVALIRLHLVEALTLSLISAVWVQFLMSARLNAVLFYPDHSVASYGLAGSLYQLGTAIIIAAFVPQTVVLYRLLSNKPADGIAYALKIATVGLVAVMVLAVLAALISPWLIYKLFPGYDVPATLLVPLMLSMVSCVIVSAFGSVFIGSGMSRLYLTILVTYFFLTFPMSFFLERWFSQDSAAVSQLIMLSFYSFSLVSVALWRFRVHLGGLRTHIVCTLSAPFVACILGLGLRYLAE